MAKHNIPQKVIDVLKDAGLDAKTATWDCHGTIVVLHKALEVVAVKMGVTYQKMDVIEACAEKKIAVVHCVGTLGDRTEDSIGEAAPYNNKNAYPFAMAEKRAKDRVILKLVGLHGYAYSEDEADDFRDARPQGRTVSEAEPEEKPEWVADLIEAVNKASSAQELNGLVADHTEDLQALPAALKAQARAAVSKRKAELEKKEAA